ncbi:DsbA family protein [Nitrosopumilus maritimus]|uniref:DSBA oxidoreductase n=1 Tax=Nitrosopumilus maritimus (strain SCM1) TaxID=436308 RepID=A9A1Q1_NITMS|nr:DsbA family protein [Nitrosopumilus maritimus]ABX13566.1 DSBA oxidoreductase [Nitrosopumilus maritimus SCM1]
MDIIDIVKNNKTTLIASIVLVIAIALYFTEIQAKNNSDLGETNSLDAKILPETEISKDDDPLLGNPDAPISIIEFSDYQCPFCARFYTQTLPTLESEYIEKGKVNFIYRDFPIQNHPNARPAALASECADEQEQFWEYHDILFKKQDMWKRLDLDTVTSTFKEYAEELNLNQEMFDSCLDSEKYSDEVDSDFADGRSYKISGTPTFFIGNEETGYSSVFGAKSFYEFQEIIEEKLDKLEK